MWPFSGIMANAYFRPTADLPALYIAAIWAAVALRNLPDDLREQAAIAAFQPLQTEQPVMVAKQTPQ